MIKKILEKIGGLFFGLVIVAIGLFSLFLGFGNVAEMVVKIVSFIGGGSIGLGIIMAPFFIFGIVQIFRGCCAIFDADLKKMGEFNKSIWHYLYVLATIFAYIAVIVVLYCRCTSA